MNTGLSDAVNLSWKIAQVLQGRIAPAALNSYEQERIGFARQLVATTDRVFQAAVADGAAGRLVRHWLLPHVAPFLTGFAAARRAMFKRLSQIRINDEDSMLSAGRAGDIHGGDRLPWVHDAQHDNFDPLRSMDWQLHVYGVCGAALASQARALDLPVHCLPWTSQAATTDLLRDAAYLVRPDGYVALCLARQESADLSDYATRHGLHFADLERQQRPA
ncbi:FAD-dependent monooxygenase [Rugamonas fusca]|nr:FAD-dependent monooxygenase [Rugamonas fusca]